MLRITEPEFSFIILGMQFSRWENRIVRIPMCVLYMVLLIDNKENLATLRAQQQPNREQIVNFIELQSNVDYNGHFIHNNGMDSATFLGFNVFVCYV